MASYSFSVKTVSRSSGRSATGAAAYRAADFIVDERTGVEHNYQRKGGVVSARLYAPADAPEWAANRWQVWNEAEQAERRKNSTVAREFLAALPHEMTDAQRAELVDEFAGELVDRYGFVLDAAIHRANREGDKRNDHVHLLATTREIGADGFGKKTRVLDDRKTGRAEVERLRERWAEVTNRHLMQCGIDARVDHRSLVEQGIDRPAQIHEGPAATAMRRRDEPTERGGFNDEVKAWVEVQAALAVAQSNVSAERVEQERQALGRIGAGQAERRQAAERAEQVERERQALGRIADGQAERRQAAERQHAEDVAEFEVRQDADLDRDLPPDEFVEAVVEQLPETPRKPAPARSQQNPDFVHTRIRQTDTPAPIGRPESDQEPTREDRQRAEALRIVEAIRSRSPGTTAGVTELREQARAVRRERKPAPVSERAVREAAEAEALQHHPVTLRQCDGSKEQTSLWALDRRFIAAESKAESLRGQLELDEIAAERERAERQSRGWLSRLFGRRQKVDPPELVEQRREVERAERRAAAERHTVEKIADEFPTRPTVAAKLRQAGAEAVEQAHERYAERVERWEDRQAVANLVDGVADRAERHIEAAQAKDREAVREMRERAKSAAPKRSRDQGISI